MTPTKHRYNFWINETEAQGLRRVKAAVGISESEQIRQAIRDWLRTHDVTGKPERKRAMKRQGGGDR
jgi:hypothetical protein